MSFSDLMVNLRLNIAGFSSALNTARQQTQRFSSQIAALSRNGSADELIAGYTTLNERLHIVGLGARDVARIVAGMAVSQTFYSIARSIREATDALWEFNEGLDYAQVTYGALFGNTDLASNFIDTLKKYSVETIFEYSDIEGMARKLSAYGIEYKNLMYIIEGLTNIGTISGDNAALERLAVAIGQINAKGTLKAEEMRQLANAYTPIYDILREKLGLTEEQLGSVGDLGIPAYKAINAIVEYANEQFGDTAEAAVYTITGLKNKVVDTLKVMGAEIMAPVSIFFKSLLKYTADSLNEIHAVFKQSGIGGVFEHLVPDEAWQQRIRSLIAAVKNVVATSVAHFMTLWPYLKQFLGGVIDAITVFLGVMNTAGTAFVGFMRTLANHTPILNILTKALIAAAAGWVLFKIHALGAAVISVLKVVIVDVAKAVVFLTTVLTKSPIVAGLLLFGAVLIGVASNAKSTNNAISNLINSLNSFSIGGSTADDILQVEDAMQSGTDASDEFWNAMGEGAESAEDAIDGAGKAAKKAGKSLLSFDEVFKLNDDAASGAGSGFGSLDGLENLSDAFSGLGEALIPDIPDLSTFAKDFVNSLYNSIFDSIKTIASGGATGAVIGALVGFGIGGLVTKTMAGALTGAKWGAKIGTVAGAAFAGFWTDTYKEMESSLVKIATGAGSGMLIGGLLGMVVGAFATKTIDGALAGAKYGAAIGSLIGAGIGAFWADATDEMSNAIEGIVVGGAMGALVGGLAGLLIGAFSTRTLQGALTAARLGAGIGALVGGAFGGIFGAADEELRAQIQKIVWGGAEGMLVGGLAGMIIGAFATRTLQGAMTGAKLGSTIGGLVGGTIGGIFGEAEESLSDALSNLFADISAASYGAFFGGLVGMIIGAIVGAFAGGVGAIPGAKVGATLGSAIGGLGGLLISYLQNSGITEAFSEWLGGIWGSITTWFSNITAALGIIFSALGMLISDWWTSLITDIGTWLSDIGDAIAGAFKATKEWFVDDGNWKGITLLIVNPVAGAAKLLYDNNSEFKKWIDDLYDKVSTGFSDIKLSVETWASNTWNSIETWTINTLTSIDTWWTDTKRGFSVWVSDTKTNLGTWAADTVVNIATWSVNAYSKVNTWWTDTKRGFSIWVSDTETSIGTWAADTVVSIATWSVNAYSKVNTWWTDTKRGFNIWVSDTKTSFGIWASETAVKLATWYTETSTNMSNWITQVKTNLKGWWANLWNPSTWTSGWDSVKKWFSDLFTSISNWFTNIGKSISSWWDGLWNDKSASVDIDGASGGSVKLGGHAKGGIFSREHIARFAEGNKAEAIIPLEDKSAMQPFVTAISDGILQGLLPAMANGNGGNANTLPPMWVGTLIADDTGLQQLYKKFQVYEAKEEFRKGL